MAVAIRLRRTGAKKRPFYRIVVTDNRTRLGGKYIESLGYYNPISPEQLEMDVDKAVDWLNRGARPSETVRSLLVKSGAIQKWRGDNEETAEAAE
ncbi:MAG: 30S ribosomal protein S16 [Gemmatimonadetes bacterium]|nr:30S ribosomal protein S16 [Gemmatimonadota bacterium]MDE2847795.1 30S ribosomal protein S16 [Gemmatimonadota bacterium]MXX05059.1 30S ribosomal protein S16 [Gemmatimonadota bacterium]MXY97777.1 30S ribosomal protein S16 [Gemmatimonadota bacterium]MXZ74983.1 30S ribosomal protein S16 [Gemmatimonadota bacterium]